MDLLARFLNPPLQATYGPDHDFWYTSAPGIYTMAGLPINAESAQKVSAYFRGVDILSTTLAMLPLGAYQRTEAGRESADSIVVADVCARKPNSWQNSFDWRRQQMRHLIHHGNGYNRIVPGSRGFLDQLWPIHPTLVTPRQLETTGRVVYDVRNPKDGQRRTYTQDEIFHLRGVSEDGIVGKGVLDYARDSLGLALVIESYASKLFSRGALHGGTIEVPGLLDDDASKRMVKSYATQVGDWHLPKLLEQGAKWVPSSMEPEKAQMILSRQFSVNDIARWLGLPPHMLADLERSTNNNIEHQGQEFVTYNLGPWLTLFESAINDQLIIQTGTYYVEFVRDALVRGDIKSRWEAYMKAVTTGVYTRNEVRELENRNKLPGLDEPLDPAHITGNRQGGSDNEPAPDRDTRPRRSVASLTRAEAIVHESAARVLRKEITAITKAAVKHADDDEAFKTWAREFYTEHVELVAATMVLDPALARAYCAMQLGEVLEDGVQATEGWTPEYLAGLALDGPKPAPPPPQIHAHTTIAEGAVAVTTPDILVQAPITMPEVNLLQPGEYYAEGAIQNHEHVTQHHAHTHLPPPMPKTQAITKTVTRDAKGQITEVMEQHALEGGEKKSVRKRITRNTKGQIAKVIEDHE